MYSVTTTMISLVSTIHKHTQTLNNLYRWRSFYTCHPVTTFFTCHPVTFPLCPARLSTWSWEAKTLISTLHAEKWQLGDWQPQYLYTEQSKWGSAAACWAQSRYSGIHTYTLPVLGHYTVIVYDVYALLQLYRSQLLHAHNIIHLNGLRILLSRYEMCPWNGACCEN